MRKLIFSSLLLAVTGFWNSCSDSKPSKYPGFSEAKDGVYYKLHTPGESGKKPTADDFLELRLKTFKGKQLIFDSEWQSVEGTVVVPFSNNPYYNMLAEGDSATLYVPPQTREIYMEADTLPLEMQVKVVRVITAQEYDNLVKPEDPDVLEQLLIAKYLKKQGLQVISDSLGIFQLALKTGNGNSLEAGKKLKVHFKGSFLNGTVFDDTRARNQAMEFNWGEEGQVIKGIALILSRMKAGGQAKIILPSRLAFGNEGSSTGLIPPHAPVVYEIELLEVN
ncbi:MAG: FKBP-type peptidyl-prolyl cis-trans isomerase [Bacteroidia bacterium]